MAQATTTFLSRVKTRVRKIKSPACRYRRTGSRRPIVKRFWRRRLHVCLVKRCRHRLWDVSMMGPRLRQHRRWRRRKARWIKRDKVKRRNAFLREVPSATKLWNRHRKANAEFLGATVGSFKPFLDHGVVPEEVLDSFVVDRGRTFLAGIRLLQQFEHASLAKSATETVHRLNLFGVNLGLHDCHGEHGKQRRRKTAKDCPLVWDTGASFGLTPFRSDFVDYTECNIPVNDIARTNMVIGLGTTLHRFELDGETFFLPCLSYHLPSAEIRLFSPQTYHTIYGGHSSVNGNRVEKYIDRHKLTIPIDRQVSNVPMVYNCGVTAQEMKNHGPFIRSALPAYEKMVDCMGSCNEANFTSWKMATEIVNDEFEHYKNMGFMLPNVGLDANKNLSSAQKELLLWHWKLGISMQRVQELMRVVQVEERNGGVSTMDRVIVPKIQAAANCPIPLCQSCQLSRARLRKPKITKSKAITEVEGAISKEKYEVGDFVSTDQYVIRMPG